MFNFAIHVLPLHGYLIPDEKGRGSARGVWGLGASQRVEASMEYIDSRGRMEKASRQVASLTCG